MSSTPRSMVSAVSDFVRDSLDAWKAGRVAGLLQEWRESLVFPAFRHGRLVVIEQELSDERQERVPAGVTISVQSSEDWAGFAAIVRRRVIARMRRAVSQGRTCIIARRDGAVIGYTWISDRVDTDLEWFPIPLPEDAAYGWNLFVTPSERSSGVGSALVSARLNYARSRGFRSMWRAIDATNAPTVRTVEKTWGHASRVVGELRYVKILGWTHGWLKPHTDAAAVITAKER